MAYNTPKEVAYEFCKSGVEKAKMPVMKFALLAIIGGAFVAMGGLLSVIVTGGMPGIGAENPGLVKFISGAFFPVGLIMVTIAGGDLFTSDCTGQIIPYLQKEIQVRTVMKVLLFSYIFNFIGTQFVAFFMANETGLLSENPWREYLHNIATKKVDASFYTNFIKGIGANWMVCIGAWMGIAGRDIASKCIGIWIPVMAFVTLGFEHSIANMFFIPAAIYSGAEISWTDFIINNLTPATLGNIVAGFLFVGAAYWYIFMRRDHRTA